MTISYKAHPANHFLPAVPDKSYCILFSILYDRISLSSLHPNTPTQHFRPFYPLIVVMCRHGVAMVIVTNKRRVSLATGTDLPPPDS